MTGVVIQPAASRYARQHYVDTVENPVDISARQNLLGIDFAPLLTHATDGKIALWGVQPGKNGTNIKTYQKLRVGDIAIFTRDKVAFASGEICYLFHNPQFAEEIWGRSPEGETWEYMYALTNIEPRNIPYARLCEAIGSKPNDNFMGFRPLDAVKSAGALELLGVENSDSVWDLAVGTEIKRTEVHKRYGGAGWGGIEPSAKTRNILLFTNPEKGSKYGYNFDRELEDGSFQYSGDGQTGDQDPDVGGNKALLNHRLSHRALRLFESTRTAGFVRYLGEFEIGNPTYEIGRAPDINGEERNVLVFNLDPVGVTSSPSAPLRTPLLTRAVLRAPEQNLNEEHTRRTVAATTVASRSEGQLQARYEKYLTGQGHDVGKWDIPVLGTHVVLKTDLVDLTTRRVIEAKAGVSRGYVRQGIGQVLDYVFQLAACGDGEWQPVILLPGKPSQDLVALISSLHIELVWEITPGVFESAHA